ncbi:MAG: aspartyl-tRNA(Asn)/glutamyl-tRNA(Gln) amidotransferase subunit A [Gammaproteobacteria bacterium]|jgi:aspartyl-tRNA(Asn)/glutamyl-tRNA(Gln) amidotransferase subunit A
MTQLNEKSATDLLAIFKSGESSPVEVIEDCLTQIEKCESQVEAVTELSTETARIAAKESAIRWHRGEARPLEGIPFGIKDLIEAENMRTTGGSNLFKHYSSNASATVVERIQQAGGILIAKLATPEFGFGDANEGFNATNPWSKDHWTGGSSSGPAAALAARELPLALGTDTGGSIRVPAAYCGVCGLKPTFGLVPRTGVMQVSWTLDHVGPMARCVDDIALLLPVMAGYCSSDPIFSSAEGLEGLRIGVVTGWFTNGCSDPVMKAFKDATADLEKLGAKLIEIELPHAELAGTIAWVITVAEFAAMHEGHLDRLDEFTSSAAERLAAGSAISALDYLRALRARSLIQADFEQAFKTVDVIVSPGTPTTAPRIAPPMDSFFDDGDVIWLEKIARNIIIHNAAGTPAMVIPSGFEGGLPTSIQIAAAPFAEHLCLRVGAALQSVTDFHLASPGL